MLLFGFSYGLLQIATYMRKEWTDVWIRKRSRIYDIERNSREPLTRQEHETLEKFRRLTYMR